MVDSIRHTAAPECERCWQLPSQGLVSRQDQGIRSRSWAIKPQPEKASSCSLHLYERYQSYWLKGMRLRFSEPLDAEALSLRLSPGDVYDSKIHSVTPILIGVALSSGDPLVKKETLLVFDIARVLTLSA